MEEINVEKVYLTIPKEYVCTYHKLISLVADLGKEIIDDCTYACKGNGKNVLNCWSLFQAACANYGLGNKTKADFFINYIEGQLKILYSAIGKKVYTGGHYYPITPDGTLKALCSCNKLPKFEVDVQTGNLYQIWLDGQDEATFSIEDNNLVVEQ